MVVWPTVHDYSHIKLTQRTIQSSPHLYQYNIYNVMLTVLTFSLFLYRYSYSLYSPFIPTAWMSLSVFFFSCLRSL